MEFKEKKLGELCDIKGGKRLPKGKKLVDFNTGHPYIRITDMYQNKEINLNKGIMYVEEDTYKSISKYTVNSKNVIIAIVGSTIGLVSIVGETLDNANLTENCVKFINLNEIIDEYLFYFLRSSKGQEEIRKGVVGSSQPKLPIYNIENIKIKFPSIENQKKIVKILSDLDKKIELNNQINDNLQECIKILYKEKFINNFNENWKEYKLTEISEIVNGYSYKGKDLVEQSVVGMATIKNFDRIGSFKEDGFKAIEPSKSKDLQYCEKFDILIACTDLTQNADIIGNTIMLFSKGIYKKIIMSMDLVKVVPKNNTDKFMLYTILNSDSFKNFALGYTTGTTVLHLNKKCFQEFKIKLPENNEVKAFVDKIIPMYKKMSEIFEENIILEKLKKIILPKLMNGELI